MGCFQQIFLKAAKECFKTPKEILERYENNFSVLPSPVENGIQATVFKILKTIVNYDSFFEFTGLPKKSVEEMDKLLKQAVLNSKAKRYHGTLDEINELPPSDI
jgi:hypothetical protein